MLGLAICQAGTTFLLGFRRTTGMYPSNDAKDQETACTGQEEMAALLGSRSKPGLKTRRSVKSHLPGVYIEVCR